MRFFSSALNQWLKPEEMKIRKELKILSVLSLGILVGTLVLPLFLAGDIYDYQDTLDGFHLPPIDVIVCLAGGRGRIVASGDLWYRYWEQKKAPKLYISGMGHQSNWQAFQKQLRTGVREVITQEDVILETESSNTENNARWFGKYLVKEKWKRILLVTSPYHMKRASYIFSQILSQPEIISKVAEGENYDPKNTGVRIETLSIFQEPFEPSEWRMNFNGIRVTIIEYIKWIYYRRLWSP